MPEAVKHPQPGNIRHAWFENNSNVFEKIYCNLKARTRIQERNTHGIDGKSKERTLIQQFIMEALMQFQVRKRAVTNYSSLLKYSDFKFLRNKRVDDKCNVSNYCNTNYLLIRPITVAWHVPKVVGFSQIVLQEKVDFEVKSHNISKTFTLNDRHEMSTEEKVDSMTQDFSNLLRFNEKIAFKFSKVNNCSKSRGDSLYVLFTRTAPKILALWLKDSHHRNMKGNCQRNLALQPSDNPETKIMPNKIVLKFQQLSKINPLNTLSFSFNSYATVIERSDGLIGSKEETSKSRRFSIAAAAAAAAAAADAGELNSFSLCGFVDSVAAAEELCV
uniref:Uncharacterized protein n=1 Tax=Glossina austeni TaxID=7395 RepID=A0A1A9UYM9_GLOAU